MSEAQLRANVRQVAMEAERHFWTSRLRNLSEGWKGMAGAPHGSALLAAAIDIDRLISERSR